LARRGHLPLKAGHELLTEQWRGDPSRSIWHVNAASGAGALSGSALNVT
jgi:hypothetical protein